MGGHLNVVQYLIEEKKVSYNRTARWYYRVYERGGKQSHQYGEMYLIKQGADVHIKTNSDGKTALIVALEASGPQIW